jgi:hypothetical protein
MYIHPRPAGAGKPLHHLLPLLLLGLRVPAAATAAAATGTAPTTATGAAAAAGRTVLAYVSVDPSCWPDVPGQKGAAGFLFGSGKAAGAVNAVTQPLGELYGGCMVVLKV